MLLLGASGDRRAFLGSLCLRHARRKRLTSGDRPALAQVVQRTWGFEEDGHGGDSLKHTRSLYTQAFAAFRLLETLLLRWGGAGGGDMLDARE